MRALAIAIVLALAPRAGRLEVLRDPPPGRFYHGVFPGGGPSGMGSHITPQGVAAYTRAAGKPPTWVYFWDNWYEGREFPRATAEWIRAAGSVPYLRLMLLSSPDIPRPEPVFSLENILRGRFDADLRRWMRAARAFGTPLIAEYGTEMNGWWFPWNGQYNREGGSYEDGVARFRRAYRHIISIAREEGALNIRWVFHVDPWDEPHNVAWNRFENYYPGDEWIDWLGASVYGRQIPHGDAPAFRWQMDSVYRRFVRMSRRPVIVCEFGAIAPPDQAEWAGRALRDLTGRRWPRVIGFCWWNERFRNDPDPRAVSDMRLQDNPALAAVFRKYVGSNRDVLAAPVVGRVR